MSRPRAAHEASGAAPVRIALLELKSAMQELLSAVPGLAGFRPVDIESALGIDLKLAWKVSHLAHAGDPFDAVRHLPGDLAGSIVAEAARRRGVPAARIAAMRKALAIVQELGTAWAGSKRAFVLLSANLATAEDGRFALERRKELFHGGMHVWGMRASSSFRVDILHPATNGRLIDCLTVRGFVDLERLRFDAAWRLDGPVVVDDRGRSSSRSIVEAPKGVKGERSPFLVPELCSGTMTILDRVAGGHALHLATGEVGRASSTTVVHAAIVRRVQPRGPSKDYSGIFQVFRLRTPSESQEFVVGVHRSLVPVGVQPDAVVYGDLYGAPERRVPYHLGDRLQCSASVEQIAPRLKLRVVGVPNLEGWVGDQLSALGWPRGDLLWFKATVSFPPVPSTLVVQMPQAE